VSPAEARRPKRPSKGRPAARYRQNTKTPPRLIREERALVARLGVLR
jgi:hypothetical protein